VVIYPLPIWQHMDIGAFWSKLTIALTTLDRNNAHPGSLTNLSKVLAHVISGAGRVMTKRTRLPGLTCTLAKELARHMRRVYKTHQQHILSHSTQNSRPTLFARRAARPIEPASHSRHHRTHHLRLAVPIRLSQTIRDAETSRTHVPVRRDLAHWYATAHAAVPGVRRGAVAKHVRLLLRFGVRIGGVVARMRKSRVGSD